jgi:cathepsin B
LTPCEDTPTIEPTCQSSCPSNSNLVYADEKVLGASSYGIRGVESIKKDISTYGTVTAAFTVYEDFYSYSSGVYEHMSGDALGGHAIKMIGWGVEEGVDYWLCINSWNETWGDQGTFKIKMGNCGINNQVHAGLAQ